MSPTRDTIHIAFLGIGLMGKPMAQTLLAAGYRLSVWNRSPAKAAALQEYGAELALDAATAVAQADVVITMLDAGPVVLEVVQQIAPALRAGAIVIDMSSTRPDEARQCHAMLAARAVGFIDAPVSGGVIGAQAGTLAIMAGGSVADFNAVAPLFDVLGRATHVGAAGTGQLAKLCNQLIVGGTINIIAEALLLAQAGGADPVAVRQALRGGFAESRILEVHGQRMLERAFIPGGQVKTQAKDMENILSAAAAVGLTLPLSQQVAAIYAGLLPDYPQADHSAALLALEQRNPGLRLGSLPDQLP
ncbi:MULTISPECIES: NAD(P)-dependent oxidoreductase [unclassified Undibacterium]|uniref:NAD(P)-dependent oxidoreductase n=1 Tax=unclassified Undibacterium TaxID=2630295 RepID=UPI002AC8D5D3|nr:MULTISPECIES: NAD(P)-dependent oxidoreductase [unclassified Undibacterium]MEB0138279.1 NAD(P)-dependent oxidoreductase [Undibacterium sp. CCC2.1]MEB0171560.1 NAD(P)-dependent oxidoreductase [Undibacterium sp. CCC1.1]MEB0175520.1 NAD(P)-dependent oxidoreductase [Undibacterium sp. CCC3.4]MEB0214760.1 NAD(P)-dependent oxidoreductase [Undibacterium sp. 5I2]WPX45247.1 NAD(P)-dependent oxidoreductase [Undibacterium sp. CCC3.4]